MILGIHASVRKGFVHALQEAAALNCHTVQIFPRKPGTDFISLTPALKNEINQLRKKRSIFPLIVHSVYQPNIASTNPNTYQRSRESLAEELDYSQQLGAEYLIIHPGNYSEDSNLKEGIKKSAQTIQRALEQVPSPIKIVIENVGGGGRRMGGRFEELQMLLESVNMPERIGICLDTAHAFCAGFPIQSAAGIEDCLTRFDQIIGLKYLEIFHVNDSAVPQGSHKDVHQHIGKGYIGLEPLRHLVHLPQFKDKPGILETPKFPMGSDKINLNSVR